MSETTTAPAGGVEGNTPATPAASDSNTEYNEIVDQLNEGGFAPSSDQDDPDQQYADEDGDSELIKLKVNGKTIEKPLQEVIKLAQQYEATSMKLETAKREIEEARATKTQLQTQQNAVRDLLGVMQRGEIDKISEFVHEKLGAGDVWDKALVKAALNLYEISKMSPEQREALENRKLVQKLKAEAEERAKHEQERSHQFEVNRWSEYIGIEVPKAIKDIGLPDTDFVREHIIGTWRAALERGQTPTPKAVAAYVKKRLDDAKMLGQVAPKPPVPVATKDSVRRRVNGKAEQPTGYQNWDDWKKTRGH